MIRWRIRWSWALYACFWRSAVLYPGEGAGACHLVMWFIENIFWRRSCPYFLGCVQRSLLLLCLLSTLTRSAWEADLPLKHPTRPFRSLSFRVGFVFSVYVERQSWQASPSSAIFIMTYSAVCERAFQAISGSWLLSAGKVKDRFPAHFEMDCFHLIPQTSGQWESASMFSCLADCRYKART